MRILSTRRRAHPRRFERGAALVEAALLIPLLVPLTLGMIEYGHYFWITINAVEAAKWGAASAASTNAASPAVGCTTDPNPAKVPGITATAQTAASTYLTTNSPSLVSYATVTVTCVTSGNGQAVTNPSWQSVVKMDFPPVVGFRLPWMKQSSSHSGWLTYTTPAVIRTY